MQTKQTFGPNPTSEQEIVLILSLKMCPVTSDPQ